MKIVLAEHLGMCFGVRDAIAQAEEMAEKAPLTILGELVHNPIVRERLRAQGVAEGSLDQSEATSGPVMITAHGTLYLRALEFPKGTPYQSSSKCFWPIPITPSTTNNV